MKQLASGKAYGKRLFSEYLEVRDDVFWFFVNLTKNYNFISYVVSKFFVS
jgi:hypothetical protein